MFLKCLKKKNNIWHLNLGGEEMNIFFVYLACFELWEKKERSFWWWLEDSKRETRTEMKSCQ